MRSVRGDEVGGREWKIDLTLTTHLCQKDAAPVTHLLGVDVIS